VAVSAISNFIVVDTEDTSSVEDELAGQQTKKKCWCSKCGKFCEADHHLLYSSWIPLELRGKKLIFVMVSNFLNNFKNTNDC
jgi:hypothetical protein